MTAATLTLTEFLLARIAEDEASVKDGPARIRAECEAKRRIVEYHGPMRYLSNCEGCWEEGGYDGAPLYPCRTVKWLSLPYADHPDYRDEWRP